MIKNIFSFKPQNGQNVYGNCLLSLFESSNLKIVDIGSGNGIGPGIGNFSEFATTTAGAIGKNWETNSRKIKKVNYNFKI